jgi:hypothetical protein
VYTQYNSGYIVIGWDPSDKAEKQKCRERELRGRVSRQAHETKSEDRPYLGSTALLELGRIRVQLGICPRSSGLGVGLGEDEVPQGISRIVKFQG